MLHCIKLIIVSLHLIRYLVFNQWTNSNLFDFFLKNFSVGYFSHRAREKQNSKSNSNNENMTAHPMSYKQQKGKQNERKSVTCFKGLFLSYWDSRFLQSSVNLTHLWFLDFLWVDLNTSQKLLKLIVSLFHRQGWATKPAQKKSK